MAETTRVPLQPIKWGSLIMLLLGVVLGIALSAGYAWWSVPRVDVDTVTAGTGEHPKKTDVVFVRYTGKLEDGTVFDQSPAESPWPVKGIMPEGTPMLLSNMLPGFQDAVVKMQKGGKYKATIPASMAYGATPQPQSRIPANADLVFDIELVDSMTEEKAQALVQQLQQAFMQQQQQQGEAAPGGAPGAPAPAPAPTPETR